MKSWKGRYSQHDRRYIERGNDTLEDGMEDEPVSIEVNHDGTGGAGIDAEKNLRFFFQTKEIQPSGLGLRISYGMIYRHHVEIRVKHREGTGTPFRIELPVGKE